MVFSKNYFCAVATLAGMIIGAGIFALPLIVVRSGWLIFLGYILVLALAQFLVHLLYAKIILSASKPHRIPGHAEYYGGKRFKNLASFFVILGSYGTLLAYIILGGIFFHGLFSPYLGGGVFAYTTVLFILQTLIVFGGFKTLINVETWMTILLVLSLIFLVIKSFAKIDIDNYVLADSAYWFLPYGPIFFAIGGEAAIPEVCKLLEKDKKKIKSAIFWGTILPAILMAIFALVMAGVTGSATTPDTLTGLREIFGNGLVSFALFFGLLCIISSCILIMQATREVFWWDFKMDKNFSLVLAALVPFIFYFFGLRNLTTVVAVSGAITGSAIGTILMFLAIMADKKPQVKPAINIRPPRILIYILSGLFVIGLLSELIGYF